MLMKYLLSASVLGFVVAIPPGSVTAVACQRSLTFGFRNSIIFSLGSSLSDIFYISLVLIGVSSFIANNLILRIGLWLVCGAVLCTLGIISLISINKPGSNTVSDKMQKNKLLTFLSGVLVTLTNPVTIVGWIAVAGNFMLIWNEKYPESKDHLVLTVFFIILGVLAWFLPLTFAVSRLRHIMNRKLEKVLILTINSVLILFGTIALFNGVKDIVHLQ